MFLQDLAKRLARLGMPFEGERLEHAGRIVRAHTEHPDQVSDVMLMTLCVEAYRRPEVDLPAWI